MRVWVILVVLAGIFGSGYFGADGRAAYMPPLHKSTVGTAYMLSADVLSNDSVLAPVSAAPYTLTRDCWPEEAAAPEGFTFDGVILTYEADDGIKALRSDVGTSYYIAFAGSNFIEGAGISPDGAYIAIPYGLIQTAAASDVRYSVGEIRVYDTARVPQIRRFLPWRASFQMGDIFPLTWLDDERFLFRQGSFIEGQTAVTLLPFAESPEPLESPLGAYESLSPDTSRAIGRFEDGFAVYDTAAAEMILRLPELRSVRWSPDSETFVAVVVDGDARHLQRFNRSGEPLELIFSFTHEQNLWNLAWSPDSTGLLFSLYDPQEDENPLYVVNLPAQTVTDTCVMLSTLHSGDDIATLNTVLRGAGAVWSPDGEQVALITGNEGTAFQIAAANGAFRYSVTGYAGGLMKWGLGE